MDKVCVICLKDAETIGFPAPSSNFPFCMTFRTPYYPSSLAGWCKSAQPLQVVLSNFLWKWHVATTSKDFAFFRLSQDNKRPARQCIASYRGRHKWTIGSIKLFGEPLQYTAWYLALSPYPAIEWNIVIWIGPLRRMQVAYTNSSCCKELYRNYMCLTGNGFKTE